VGKSRADRDHQVLLDSLRELALQFDLPAMKSHARVDCAAQSRIVGGSVAKVEFKSVLAPVREHAQLVLLIKAVSYDRLVIPIDRCGQNTVGVVWDKRVKKEVNVAAARTYRHGCFLGERALGNRKAIDRTQLNQRMKAVALR